MNINLFVYGTLRNKSYQKAITGKIFKNEKATLLDYKRFAPKDGFPYIIQKPGKKVIGIVLMEVDEESLKKFDDYEENGILYERKIVKVKVKQEIIDAYAYIANVSNLRRSYGDKIDYDILHSVEKYFENKIGERVDLISNHSEVSVIDTALEHRAKLEIYSCQIHQLINTFYNQEYFSEFEIDKELKQFKEPDMKNLDKNIIPYIDNYIYLIMKSTILNQLENKIRAKYIRETFVKYPFWIFTKSILASLKILNINSTYIDLLIKKSSEYTNCSRFNYRDIIMRCLKISDLIFSEFKVQIYYIIKEIEMSDEFEGKVPLGVELEFSELGKDAVLKPMREDYLFNNFKYFYQLDLVRRLWKLGGHIDDHKISEQFEKKGGFLELAPGKNTMVYDESVPVTNNPKLLNELIQEICKFINIRGHSIHFNLQIDEKYIDWNLENDIDDLKCLLTIGGDWHRMSGHFFENRFRFKEIEDDWGSVNFSTLNHHSLHSIENCKEKCSVIEFQFPRLKIPGDYELLIMTLKGYQMSGFHRPIVSRESSYNESLSKQEMTELKKWASDALPLNNDKIKKFVEKVERGFMTEHSNKSYHKISYINEILFNLEKELTISNEYIKLARKVIVE